MLVPLLLPKTITTARITQQETELARLKEQIKQLSAANKPSNAKNDGDLDETLALYWEKQMEDEADFVQFCLAKDRGFPEN